MNWILENGYRERVPPPSSGLERVLGEIDDGASPFQDRRAFHSAVNRYLDDPETLGAEHKSWIELKL